MEFPVTTNAPLSQRLARRVLTPTITAGLAAGLLAAPALGRQAADPAPEAPETASAALTAAAAAADGPVFPIGRFQLGYLREALGQPSIDVLNAVPVTLGRTDSGYVAPRPGLPAVTFTVGELSERGVESFHASGLQTVLVALRDALVDLDLLAIYVVQDPAQISPTGEDRRAGTDDLTIIITTGTVREVRTVAQGERAGERGDIGEADRINGPQHARILSQSPVIPSDPPSTISRRAVDDYVYHLGRHPGRRVDVALAPSVDPGEVTLDYLVTENRPLVLYASVSNTGTASTDYWRQRFGLLHTQLTGADDVFSVEYTTANFDDVHAVSSSYERPLTADGRVRGRAYGTFSRYDASDIGIFSQDFTGENVALGLEAAWNVYQKRELFVDVIGGIRYDDISVEQTLFNSTTKDSAQFIVPYIGARVERVTDWHALRAAATIEFQADLLDNEPTDLDGLGRTSPDDSWTVLRYGGQQSVYLEPLFNREAWSDPTTPDSSTLAHEMRFSLQGQFAFGDRLIPQSQGVIGGLYTVRGYPQSVIAGDSSVVGSIEYRFHLPRTFGVSAQTGELFGEPFRYAPQFVYGTPDWDLILKGFVDVGTTDINDPLSFEGTETLIGAGVGLELLYRRNLNVRLDWGFALEELEGRGVASGANRLHLLATILF
jgi:hemolysin activation/secretion protein